MAVPYTFGTATAAIPLSQLDSNFNTAITIGNTAVQLGNTISELANVSLVNATVTSFASPITAAQGGTGLATLTSNNVVLGNGTGNVLLVAPGTSGNALVSNGTTWSSSAVSANVSTVTGVLPVSNGGTGAASLTANNVLLGNGTSAVKIVAPGTSGNVLTSNGTTWASTALGSSNAMTLISTQTASSSATLQWTGLSGYNNYIMIFDNLLFSTSGYYISIVFGTGSGPTYITSGYFQQRIASASSTLNSLGAGSTSYGFLVSFISTYPAAFNVSGSSVITGMTSLGSVSSTSNFNGNSIYMGTSMGSVSTGGVPITAIQIAPGAGNFTSGTASLYGISS